MFVLQQFPFASKHSNIARQIKADWSKINLFFPEFSLGADAAADSD
jgi:hypothetical protein